MVSGLSTLADCSDSSRCGYPTWWAIRRYSCGIGNHVTPQRSCLRTAGAPPSPPGRPWTASAPSRHHLTCVSTLNCGNKVQTPRVTGRQVWWALQVTLLALQVTLLAIDLYWKTPVQALYKTSGNRPAYSKFPIWVLWWKGKKKSTFQIVFGIQSLKSAYQHTLA